MIDRPDFAREMRRGEEAAIDVLLETSFGGTEEIALIHALRKARVVAGEQVLPMGESIVGYYALSYMIKPKGWLCLAPVAIAPVMQNKGHGRRMIGMLTEWARLTKTPVVVLGATGFYERSGFSWQDAQTLSGPFPIMNTLVAGLEAPARGQLIYPKAFG